MKDDKTFDIKITCKKCGGEGHYVVHYEERKIKFYCYSCKNIDYDL
jgi:uncharacterized Zn finger protein